VFVLPGACFGAPNFFRVVFTAPEAKLAEAFARIVAFCEAHAL
jgi:tyrosine aminotransferase